MLLQHDADLGTLGQFIRDRRKHQRMTQAQLGERIGWAQERISTLENGRYGLPSLPALALLADATVTPLPSLLAAAGYADYFASGESKAQASIALLYMLERLMSIDATTLRAALNAASDLMAEAMGAEKVDVFLYEPRSESLVALGTSNTPTGRRQHQLGLNRMPLANEGRTVDVYRTGKVFRTGNADEDQNMVIGVVGTLGVRSMVIVPLRDGTAIQGVLAAESSKRDRFSAEDQRFFEVAARWVGMIARRVEISDAFEQKVAKEARQVAADELITALAHDLRNHLTPLKGRLDLMRRRLERDERAHDLKDVNEASRGVANIQNTVSRLLDLARLDQGLFALALQPIDLAHVVNQVVEDMRGVWETIEMHCDGELEVQGDPVRVTDAVVNLITNAIQHSPKGVPIVVTARAAKREGERWAVVTIQDQGPGIDATLLPRVFERFVTGPHSRGLGLGLYLSCSIVEAHGGLLTVESSTSAGTTFALSLPCSQAE